MKYLAILLFTTVLTACSGLFAEVSEGETVTVELEQDQSVSNVLSEQTQIPAEETETVIEMEGSEEAELTEKEVIAETEIILEPEADENQTAQNTAILNNLHFFEHTVEAGDTLSGIASQYGVSIANLQEWNDLTDVTIFIGQSLTIGQDISVFREEQSEVVGATIDFLLNGQEEKSELERLNWNESFLNNLDLAAIHQQFVDGGADPDDVENFAVFLTQNAPISENWQQDFKAQMLAQHQVELTRFEPIGGDDFQTFTEQNGAEVPFAIVSSRTGYYIR